MLPSDVLIAEHARRSIVRIARESTDGLETGGILLGRGPDDLGVVRVEQAGDPGPDAVRRSDYFLRDLEHANRLADYAWQRHQLVWVGEWHTHLEPIPYPSPADLQTYRRLLSEPELQFDSFIAVIVTAASTEGWEKPTLTPWLLRISG
jgi:integrative and conjugative element protein (TIGR02256 family)